MDNENENGQVMNPTGPRTSHSDEDEVKLASSCPKKRAGRKKFKETRHPIYRGVRQRNGNRWVCEVRAPNNSSRIWLGTYRTPDMAARAHDVAALALRGPSACLNFADSAWRVRVPASTDTREIQRAAAEAAQAVRGEEMEGCRSNEEVLQDKNGGYVDEEEVFDMPGLLVNMAQGMLLPPPENAYNDIEGDCEVSLWSF